MLENLEKVVINSVWLETYWASNHDPNVFTAILVFRRQRYIVTVTNFRSTTTPLDKIGEWSLLYRALVELTKGVNEK